jgi:hypothetical protein
MGRDIGHQQRRVLDLAGRYRGVPVALVAELLGVSDRRARKVIESLVDRDAVVVVYDEWTRDRRAWTPDARWTWVNAQRWADEARDRALLWPTRTGRGRGTAR